MPTTLDSTPYEIPAVNFPRVPAAFGREGVGMDAAMSILDNAMEAQARVMEWKTKMQAAQQFRSSQIQGRQAFGELSQLNPTAPDFLLQRNAVISKYPDALLDKSAQSFLGLQEDVYVDTQREENEQWDKQYNLAREDRYERQARESAADAATRSLESRYKNLGLQGQEVYRSIIENGDDPERAINAAEYAQKDIDDQIWVAAHDIPYEIELQLRGATPEEARVYMTIQDENDPRRQRIEEKLGPINMAAAQRYDSQQKNLEKGKEITRKERDEKMNELSQQFKTLEDSLKMLDTEETSGESKMTPEQIASEKQNLRSKMSDVMTKRQSLLGIGGDSDTEGPTDYVRGGTRTTPDPDKPTDKKMKDRLDTYFK